MRTSTFEVQTHAARRDEEKASRGNNHSCFDFFFQDLGFDSQAKLTKSIFQQHMMRKSFVGIA